MSRRLLFAFVLSALTLVGGEPRILHTQASVWPRWDARYLIEIYKVAGKEITDLKWLHLHQGDAEATSVTLGVNIIDDVNPDPLTNFADIQIRYMVHGQPVSDWLSPPFTFTLQLTNSSLPAQDGFHDVSVDVQGARRLDFRPSPIILHLGRGRGASPLVPLLNLDCEYCRYDDVALKQFGSGVVYVDWHTRTFKGYPVNPAVTPWHTDPAHGDLYQEEMAPHSDLFGAEPMWWQEPDGTMDAGAKFVRALQPKMVDDSVGNYSYNQPLWRGNNADFGFGGLRNLPYKDGPRGIAWTSPYVGGVVDSTGGLVFVDKGGPLRYMKPDGEVITVAGWRVKADRDPVYFLKPFNDIRANMELRGTWTSGQYAVREDQGFHAPTDVTIDSRNEDVWYVAGFDDQCIWKVVVNRATMTGTVSVLAGDVSHGGGYADGPATAARFNGPISLTFNPIDQKLYVSDLRNDAIRRVDPDTGATTTIAGGPGQGAHVAAAGGVECYRTDVVPGCFITNDQKWNAAPARSASRFEVAAGSLSRADCYAPMPIRVDSQGRLVVLDVGFASIRQINPATGETKLLGNVEGRFDRGGLIGFFGLAVDRWGNAGPKDGIYWFQTVSGGVADGEDPNDRHANELLAWMPPGGGKSKWLAGQDWSPCPDAWGPRDCTDLPHYPWMVAVDPRGALYISGVGEHGITRWRVRRSTDPVPTNWIDYVNAKSDWAVGSTGLGPNGHSLAVKFGWEGHNYLGFANLWDSKYQTATDAVLLDDFEIPTEVRNDAPRRSRVLNFMRLNAGSGSVSVPGPTPTPGPSGDSTPPSVNVVGPTGAVRGTKIIDVSASDNVGVVGVQILLDDQALWPEIATPPYRVTWVTTTTLDGPHVITAVARDAAGNTTVSAPLNVSVSNVRIVIPGPTPAPTSEGSPWLSQSIDSSTSRVTPIRFPIPGDAVVQVDLQVYADRPTFVRIVAGRGPMCDEGRRTLTSAQTLGPDAGYRFPVVTVPAGLMPCVEALTTGVTVRGLANYVIVR